MRAVHLIAFGDELTKIAMSLDADTRNNMAMRHEVPDFLLEGRLESNDAKETGFIPKIGGQRLDQARNKRDKAQEKYRDLRKPGGAALKGGLTGSFIGQMLTGGRLGGDSVRKRMGLRGFGAVGAGLGLADHYANKRYERAKRKERYEANKAKAETPKTAMVAASQTFTPGRALTTARNTGSFLDGVIHKGAPPQPATQGQKFRLPQE